MTIGRLLPLLLCRCRYDVGTPLIIFIVETLELSSGSQFCEQNIRSAGKPAYLRSASKSVQNFILHIGKNNWDPYMQEVNNLVLQTRIWRQVLNEMKSKFLSANVVEEMSLYETK